MTHILRRDHLRLELTHRAHHLRHNLLARPIHSLLNSWVRRRRHWHHVHILHRNWHRHRNRSTSNGHELRWRNHLIIHGYHRRRNEAVVHRGRGEWGLSRSMRASMQRRSWGQLVSQRVAELATVVHAINVAISESRGSIQCSSHPLIVRFKANKGITALALSLAIQHRLFDGHILKTAKSCEYHSQGLVVDHQIRHSGIESDVDRNRLGILLSRVGLLW